MCPDSQQAAEQLSKRADEDKIKKAEDVSKQRVIALKVRVYSTLDAGRCEFDRT